MTRPDLMPLAEQERADLMELLRDLTDAQWDTPSLCPGWRVRDVAVHVVSYDELRPRQLAVMFLRAALRPDRVNELARQRYATLDRVGVMALLERTRRPRGLTAALRGGIALADGTIHHQDIRRALDLPRVVPEQRLLAVLQLAIRSPVLPSRRTTRGLRLVATDVDWHHGDGPEVSGPGEALLMAAAGRRHALADLSGEGLAVLGSRLPVTVRPT